MVTQAMPISGGCAKQPHPNHFGETGTYLRILTITDVCGNSSTAEVFINLVDTVSPYFTFVPDSVIFECSEDIIFAEHVAEDWVEDVQILEDRVQLHGLRGTVRDRSYRTAYDNCDNQAVAMQVITIDDTTKPDVEVPADFTVDSKYCVRRRQRRRGEGVRHRPGIEQQQRHCERGSCERLATSLRLATRSV